jgi:uncharacterized protein (DUF433 family)
VDTAAHTHLLRFVPVRILFEYIETGETMAEFLDEFPSVSRALAQGVLQKAKQAVVHAHSD